MILLQEREFFLSLQPVYFDGNNVKLRLTIIYANNSTVSSQRTRGYR